LAIRERGEILALFSNEKERAMTNDNTQTATFAGGCFWCTEAVLQRLRGVKSVMPGYTGGHVPSPSYEAVCTGATGHAEAIQITFDPSEISFEQLLEVHFATHDPTTLNRQGYDSGTQYRSAIFYHDEAQKETAERVIAAVNASGAYANPVVTEVTPFEAFYEAEDYHQNFYNRNQSYPYCTVVIDPKVQKLMKGYKDLLVKEA
jgi:peptide-methionine (S)-S-oxide reductase